MVASPADLFGGASLNNLFTFGLSTGATREQHVAKVAVDAAETEINKIRGYKLKLTPPELKKLSELQKDITALEKKAREGTIRPDEIKRRSELYREADIVIGKPSANVEADETLEDYREQIDKLLAPRLNGPQTNRLNRLKTLKASLEEQLSSGSESSLVRSRLINANKQISDLTPPRRIQDLTPRERVEYDKLVKQVNDYAGAKLVLNSRDSIRVYNLQKHIDDLKSSLPPDTSSQPTPAAVARAYARLR